jgi:hypothetical protein
MGARPTSNAVLIGVSPSTPTLHPGFRAPVAPPDDAIVASTEFFARSGLIVDADRLWQVLEGNPLGATDARRDARGTLSSVDC